MGALYSLGELVEYPARALLPGASFYAVALAAAAGYLILYILVGILRGRMYRRGSRARGAVIQPGATCEPARSEL